VNTLQQNFGTVVVVDFEYEVEGVDYGLRAGDLPVPLCMVAHVLDEHLQHVCTIRMWRDELLASSRPPFDVGDGAVLVAYSAWAELTSSPIWSRRVARRTFCGRTRLCSRATVAPWSPSAPPPC
jgi:hypothetical protein